MRILGVFIALVSAVSYLESLRAQFDHLQTTVAHQASNLQQLATIKFKKALECSKKVVKKLKNKVLGKKDEEGDENDFDENDLLDADSSNLRELLEKIFKELEKHKVEMQENQQTEEEKEKEEKPEKNEAEEKEAEEPAKLQETVL